MIMSVDYASVFQKIQQMLAAKKDRDLALRRTVEILKSNVPHYNWVGIYLLEAGGQTLQLHNFLGRPTSHTRIPVSEGICGAAVRERKTVIVDDVHSDARYLACSIETKSEIVVPIQQDTQVFGEIDIDSDEPAVFGSEDRELLERVAGLLQRYF